MNVVRFHPRPVAEARIVPLPSELPPWWRTAWPQLFWLVWGFTLAMADLRNDDLQPAVLRIILGAGVLAFARPHRWVFASVAMALWVPAEPIVAAMLGWESYAQNAGTWLLPLVPAFMGGFLGRQLAQQWAAHRAKRASAAH